MLSDPISSCSSWDSAEQSGEYESITLSRVELLTVTNLLWNNRESYSSGCIPQKIIEVSILNSQFKIQMFWKTTRMIGPTWTVFFKDVYFGSDIYALLKGSEDDFRNDLLVARLAMM
jgi:hypothetical protein